MVEVRGDAETSNNFHVLVELFIHSGIRNPLIYDTTKGQCLRNKPKVAITVIFLCTGRRISLRFEAPLIKHTSTTCMFIHSGSLGRN